VHHNHGFDLKSHDIQYCGNILKIEAGDVNSGRKLAKGIGIHAAQNGLIVWLSIYRHLLVHPLFKAAQVVHAHDVVGVSVGDEHGVEFGDPLAQ